MNGEWGMLQMGKPIAIIILYNVKLEDSSSVQGAIARKDTVDVLLVDNSTIAGLLMQNRTSAELLGLSILSGHGNIGLSRAYNLALDHVRAHDPECDWIITLDQDTTLDDAYFDAVRHVAGDFRGALVYYPTVSAGGRLLSPTHIWRGFLGNARGTEKERPIVCINSGLLIHVSLFESFRYDEALFLDMVDYDLFRTLADRGRCAGISALGCTIRQDFSGTGFSGYQKDMNRFKIFARDFHSFCRKWRVPLFLLRFMLMKRAIRLAIHYRSVSFLLMPLK